MVILETRHAGAFQSLLWDIGTECKAVDVGDEESRVLLDYCKTMHTLLKNQARVNQNHD
jgi:hypothetical protein